ncbi:MAG: hypothetical protein QOH66_935 [Actinomycetota bacterium]|nr:hypothetical protein [Actinomycetota bacterium]
MVRVSPETWDLCNAPSMAGGPPREAFDPTILGELVTLGYHRSFERLGEETSISPWHRCGERLGP